MIEARKGNKTIRVTKAAYNSMFKDKGYIIVGEQRTEEEHIEEVETSEVPISEMNKEQLAQFAKEHNIDTSRARNVGDARRIVQKFVRDSKV